jgi:hypothetical protein
MDKKSATASALTKGSMVIVGRRPRWLGSPGHSSQRCLDPLAIQKFHWGAVSLPNIPVRATALPIFLRPALRPASYNQIGHGSDIAFNAELGCPYWLSRCFSASDLWHGKHRVQRSHFAFAWPGLIRIEA